MGYELKECDVFDFANYLGAQTHRKGDELVFDLCPHCDGGKNRDKHTFSINLKTGAFNCLRASCGYSGHFVELCRDFDFQLDYQTPKIYRALPQPKKAIEPKSAAIEYMASRGISEKICRKYEVTTKKGCDNIIAFPFFDEQGKLIFIKYRNAAFKKGMRGNKEWCESNTMPILYGMKQANDYTKPLVITEGQLDSLSLAEAGIPNAVSVPTGANGFTWLAPCWDWLTNFHEVIVFGDNEGGSMTLLDTLKTRLPMTVKAVRIKDYLGEKDANDILRKYGVTALQKAVKNAEVPKIENVKDLATVESVNLNTLDKIKVGIKEIDEVIGGFCMGQLILLSGKRGEGKSTFMSQIIANALEQRESVFAYSGELAAFHFKRWLDLQLAGNKNIIAKTNEYGQQEYDIAPDTVKKITEWYRGRAYIYDNDYIDSGKSEYESLPDTIEKVIKQYGVRLVCIDNLMTALSVDRQENLYLAQSNFVGRLKKIAMKYQVVILLVAHPRKSNGVFENDDVSGSADITNKADIVMSYQRDKSKSVYEGEALLSINKNRLLGTLATGTNAIQLHFNLKTRRIFGLSEKPKKYGWENPDFEELKPDEALPFDL